MGNTHAQIWEDTPNRPFLSLLQPLFQGESTCEVFVMNISFISIEIRINYDDKNFATRLASKERLRGTRKWSISDALLASRVLA